MSRTIMLIPSGTNVGLTSIILGVMHAMESKGIHLNIFKPIAQPSGDEDTPDRIITIVRKNYNVLVTEPLKMSYVQSLLSKNQKDIIMEEIIANYYTNNKQCASVVLIEGLVTTNKYQFAQSLNLEIAKMLNAEIVFVISHGTETLEQLEERIKLTSNIVNSTKNNNITGIIINKLNALIDEKGYACNNLTAIFEDLTKVRLTKVDHTKLQYLSSLPLLGTVPWNSDLMTMRAIDIAHYMNATIISTGDIRTRRVNSIIFCTCTIMHIVEQFHTGSMLVIPVDRHDVLFAACLAALNGLEIGAILLTGGYKMDDCVSKLCERALNTGLPVFIVNTNIWQTYLNLQNFKFEIQVDDSEHIKKIQEYVAGYINTDWIKSLTVSSKNNHRISPLAFRYQLTKLACKASKRIVLPEGNEPRTVKAAVICAERGIAICVLLGNPDEIYHVAASQGVKLSDSIKIINPEAVRENYVARLVELRKNKGMTETAARKQLEDNVVLGTLMLEQDEVDGLVSGAVHTTANTIRPSLQLIKTAPGSSIVSSVFFMLLPEEVYVYGDCAINPDPTAEQLAEIAIQSADSANAFGIEPRVAMLSYSTGVSGSGSDVEKVRKATHIAQKKRPDLMIDGPMQYDAAVVADVAKFKAPNSPVAGRANVFIFPDLNTGNTTYKAVQRSAKLISIGPMLQGMRKPVNDLSRGALVDDIVYTIALTAIQSSLQK